jgi:hypothetical protein
MADFKLIETDQLSRYTEACHQALKVSLDDAIRGGACTLPIWVASEDKRITYIVTDEDDETQVHGVLQFNPKLDEECEIYVNWMHSKHPRAFMMMVGRLREYVKEANAAGVNFFVYGANDRMHQFAKLTKAVPASVTYRLKL